MYAPAPSPSALVGRDRERAILHERLIAASEGHGSFVLISGEAGIGKTTLVEAVISEAARHAMRVLTGRCFDLSETPPYGPWLDLFARYPPGDDFPPLPTAFAQRGTVGEVTSQAALFQQVREFFTTLAARQPCLIFLDDVHWADPASLDLLRFLARNLAPSPLLLIATYRADELTRDDPLHAQLPPLVRETGATRLDLRPLETDAIHFLVANRYGLPDADTVRLATGLNTRAEGNPFFLGELLRTLEAEGALRATGDGWQLKTLMTIRVPPLLRQVIDRRLARLGTDAQRLLAGAAVIGQEVPLALWMAVAEADEETLANIVETAIAARVLETVPESNDVRFVHALLREALYEGVVPVRRRVWHRRVGEAIMSLPNPDPDAVAYHFQRTGDDRAVRWLIQAGERAERTYAWLTAAARYEAANDLMAASGTSGTERGWLLYRLGILRRYARNTRGISYLDEAGRIAAEIGDRLLMATVQYYHGLMHCFAGRLDDGLAELRSAAAALAALPAEDIARRATTDPIAAGIPMALTARGTLVLWLSTVGHYDEAVTLGERVIADRGSPSADRQVGKAYADACFGLMRAYAGLGRVAEARGAFERARDHYRAIEHFTLVGLTSINYLLRAALPFEADSLAWQERVAAEGEQGFALAGGALEALPIRVASLPLLVRAGRWDEALPLALAWRAAGSLYESLAVSVIGPLARNRGDVALAERIVQEALPDGPATAPGKLWFRDMQVIQRLAAALATDAGDAQAARAWLEAHDGWLAWNGSVLGRAEGQLGWAAYYRAAGDGAAAARHARQALAHATEPRQPLALIAAHRLLGELDTDARRYDAARGHLDTALALADACAAPHERALSLLARAELCVATGNRLEAVAMLDEVRAIGNALGARPTLARVDALSARLATVENAKPVYPAGLTGREVEVLRLVAAGRTNREIADALFLSLPTINNHVAHILAKTDAANRAEAAAFALRHGLA